MKDKIIGKDVPKWKRRTYTEFQRGLLTACILWAFAIMIMYGFQATLKVWLYLLSSLQWYTPMAMVSSVLLVVLLTYFTVAFLNWLFRKLYQNRYRIFPGEGA